MQRIHYHGHIISYTHKKLGEITWNRMPTRLIAESIPDEVTGQVPQALIKVEPDPVNRADLEAGDIVSGDPGPCESRNLIIRIVQVVLVLALFGFLLYVVGTWLMVRQTDEKTPDPA